jgi:hypothetical protein
MQRYQNRIRRASARCAPLWERFLLRVGARPFVYMTTKMIKVPYRKNLPAHVRRQPKDLQTDFINECLRRHLSFKNSGLVVVGAKVSPSLYRAFEEVARECGETVQQLLRRTILERISAAKRTHP